MKINFSKGIVFYQVDDPENHVGNEGDLNGFFTLEYHLNEGYWELYDGPPHRKKGCFLYITINKKPYDEWKMEKFKKRGFISPPLYSSILHFLHESQNEIRLNYLLDQTRQTGKSRPNFTFNEMESIYFAVKKMAPKNNYSWPKTERVVRETGLSFRRFNKGCKLLFGYSLPRLIQYQKMSQALKLITVDNASSYMAAKSLGYKHHNVFSKYFQKQYGINPVRLVAFGRKSTTDF